MTGDDFIRLRHQEGLSQHEFADVLGISRRTIGNLERSDHIPPKYTARLRYLGIAVEDYPPTRNIRLPHSQTPRAFIAHPFDDENEEEDDDDEEEESDDDAEEDDDDDEEEESDDFFDDHPPDDSDHITTHSIGDFKEPAHLPFEFQTVPGNLFRVLRQKLEITVSRLVRLSGLTMSDIENAESSTALVPQTLFEALVTASDLPILTEPDTFLAYLSEALTKRLAAEEVKSQAFSPLPEIASTTSGKDAALIEATHFKWAYDKVSQELSELKTEYREVSRTAAERLEKINTLQRDLDRLTVHTELADEFSQEYAHDVATLRDEMDAQSLAASNRWNDAKATALEALPSVLPALAQIAQTLLAKPQQPVYATHAPQLHALPHELSISSHHHSPTPDEIYANVNGHPPTATPIPQKQPSQPTP
jgi:transcriptional regulator with XRE-family HTH domain